MSNETPPELLNAGRVLRHRDGTDAILLRRKEDDSGWWLLGGGGLADRAIRSDDWTVTNLTNEYELAVHHLAVAIALAFSHTFACLGDNPQPGPNTVRHARAVLASLTADGWALHPLIVPDPPTDGEPS